MATFSKIPLSQSINGKSVLLSLSASPILLHTTNIDTSYIDEIYMYASNSMTYDTVMTLYWGTSSVAISNININAYTGLTTLVPGLILRGDGITGSSIYASVVNPSAVNITGYVNRITP